VRLAGADERDPPGDSVAGRDRVGCADGCRLPQNVARAEARFPQPIEPFESPFAALLRG
jgi:hypothetical protein